MASWGDQWYWWSCQESTTCGSIFLWTERHACLISVIPSILSWFTRKRLASKSIWSHRVRTANRPNLPLPCSPIEIRRGTTMSNTSRLSSRMGKSRFQVSVLTSIKNNWDDLTKYSLEPIPFMLSSDQKKPLFSKLTDWFFFGLVHWQQYISSIPQAPVLNMLIFKKTSLLLLGLLLTKIIRKKQKLLPRFRLGTTNLRFQQLVATNCLIWVLLIMERY